MRICLLVLGASLSVFVASEAQDGTPTPSSAAPLLKITAINSEGVPVRLESARVAAENGQMIVECEATNTSNDPLVRLETTLLVYGEAGRREGLQVDEIPQEDLPIQPHSNRSLRLSLRTVAIQQGDQLRLGVTTAATATDIWANTRFVADSDAALGESTVRETDIRRERVGPPEPIVINPEDAPAAVVDVVVVRTSSGAPLVVHATVRNQLREPLMFNEVEVLVFDSDGGIRTRAFKPDMSRIAASASRTEQININGGIPKEIIVVTLARAATPTQRWENKRDMAEARAAVIRMRHSLGERR